MIMIGLPLIVVIMLILLINCLCCKKQERAQEKDRTVLPKTLKDIEVLVESPNE
jgi:hypothetical protein